MEPSNTRIHSEFRVNICTNGDEFDKGDDHGENVARILREIADKLEWGETYTVAQPLFDAALNFVGTVAYTRTLIEGTG